MSAPRIDRGRIVGELSSFPVYLRLPALLALLAACASVRDPSPGFQKSIWVTRFDWKSAEDIERVIADCAAAGFTGVIFQVRGNGTALWNSRQEVWSEKFEWKNPGFDPLQTAVAAAHARGIELHAWVNVMPGWTGEKPPADQRQLWNARPQWFVKDKSGQRKALGKEGYACLEPRLPEVREYLAGLCAEIARSYAIDGIHLDYIRYTDGGVFERERTEAVTATVRAIRAAVPKTNLTAAVIADPEQALDRNNQDWGRWGREGIVDAILPMNYSDDDRVFVQRVEAQVGRAGRTPIVIGVGSYKHKTPEQTMRQIDVALQKGCKGVAVFSYAHVFGQNGRVWRDALARR
jgi:uncharacterized lipoprotein YddW (UPF0748 family)